MPWAMVPMTIAQIAPGTIEHGVRLSEDRVPRSGRLRPPRDSRRRTDLCQDLRQELRQVRTPLQFLHATALKPHAHRNANAGNPHPDAPET